jgi:hypothetical protein
MTYRVTVQHEGVDKDGLPLARGENNYTAGNTQLVFYSREEAEETFEKLWDTWRNGNPLADISQLNFTKVSLYRYDGLNAERTSEYTLIRFAQSQEKISVKV